VSVTHKHTSLFQFSFILFFSPFLTPYFVSLSPDKKYRQDKRSSDLVMDPVSAEFSEKYFLVQNVTGGFMYVLLHVGCGREVPVKS